MASYAISTVNPSAVAHKASHWWSTVEKEDERRHAWLMQREAEVCTIRLTQGYWELVQQAINKIEERIQKIALGNRKNLPGDYAIARLGEVAHKKIALADYRVSIAQQQVRSRVIADTIPFFEHCKCELLVNTR